MRNLIKLILLVLVGLIIYNYFYGSVEEKARSEKIFDGVKNVFVSVKELVQAEKEKFDAGKYDKALDKVGDLFKDFRSESQEVGDELKEQLTKLEAEKDALQERIAQKEKKGLWTEAEKEQTKEDFRQLIQKTEQLFKEADK